MYYYRTYYRTLVNLYFTKLATIGLGIRQNAALRQLSSELVFMESNPRTLFYGVRTIYTLQLCDVER